MMMSYRYQYYDKFFRSLQHVILLQADIQISVDRIYDGATVKTGTVNLEITFVGQNVGRKVYSLKL